ncbi:hypothetical protein [Chitinophaga agrisoli]|uniref:hypothetical protein n=1 Tax=Chitinophaga agrisoli TaxID=2607653 RepID=UPI001BC8E2F1|nr:hypothetical protein [Chitinophaga agrisoli]
MNILQRLAAPTPRLFKKLRAAGLVLTAAGVSVLGVAANLPQVVVSVAAYLVVGGGVLSAVSQLTVENSVVTPAAPDPGPEVAPPALTVKKGGRKKSGSATY